MDNLVIQAYNKAKSKDFFSITETLEKMLLRRYTTTDPRFSITTGQVKRILDSNKLTYIEDWREYSNRTTLSREES